MWEWKLHTYIWDAAGKWENNVNQYYSFMYIGLKQQKEAEVRGVNVCSLETAGYRKCLLTVHCKSKDQKLLPDLFNEQEYTATSKQWHHILQYTQENLSIDRLFLSL